MPKRSTAQTLGPATAEPDASITSREHTSARGTDPIATEAPNKKRSKSKRKRRSSSEVFNALDERKTKKNKCNRSKSTSVDSPQSTPGLAESTAPGQETGKDSIGSGTTSSDAAQATGADDQQQHKVLELQCHNSQLQARVNALESVAACETQLLGSIQEDLMCEICCSPLWRPCCLVPCGHVFCLGCLVQWFEQSFAAASGAATRKPSKLDSHKHCPRCRTKLTVAPVELFIPKSINEKMDAGGQALRTLYRSDRQHLEVLPDLGQEMGLYQTVDPSPETDEPERAKPAIPQVSHDGEISAPLPASTRTRVRTRVLTPAERDANANLVDRLQAAQVRVDGKAVGPFYDLFGSGDAHVKLSWDEEDAVWRCIQCHCEVLSWECQGCGRTFTRDDVPSSLPRGARYELEEWDQEVGFGGGAGGASDDSIVTSPPLVPPVRYDATNGTDGPASHIRVLDARIVEFLIQLYNHHMLTRPNQRFQHQLCDLVRQRRDVQVLLNSVPSHIREQHLQHVLSHQDPPTEEQIVRGLDSNRNLHEHLGTDISHAGSGAVHRPGDHPDRPLLNPHAPPRPRFLSQEEEGGSPSEHEAASDADSQGNLVDFIADDDEEEDEEDSDRSYSHSDDESQRSPDAYAVREPFENTESDDDPEDDSEEEHQNSEIMSGSERGTTPRRDTWLVSDETESGPDHSDDDGNGNAHNPGQSRRTRARARIIDSEEEEE